MKVTPEYVKEVIRNAANHIDTLTAEDLGADAGKIAYVHDVPETLCAAIDTLCASVQTPFRVKLSRAKVNAKRGARTPDEKPFVFILNSALPAPVNGGPVVIQSPSASPVPLALAEKAGESSAMVQMLKLEVERMRAENERLRMEAEEAEEDADEAEKTLNEVVQRPKGFWESPVGAQLLQGIVETLKPISQAAGMYVAAKFVPAAPAALPPAPAPAMNASELTQEQRQQLLAIENFRRANAGNPEAVQFLDSMLAQYSGNAQPPANA